MQPDLIAQAEPALALDPGHDPAPTLGGRLEALAKAGMRLLNPFARKDAGPVVQVHHQRRPAFALQPRSRRHMAEIGQAPHHHLGAQQRRVQRRQPHPFRDFRDFLIRQHRKLPCIGNLGAFGILRLHPHAGRPGQAAMHLAFHPGKAGIQIILRLACQNRRLGRNAAQIGDGSNIFRGLQDRHSTPSGQKRPGGTASAPTHPPAPDRPRPAPCHRPK